MLVMFPDGIERLVFPWIFAYAADYPERYTNLLQLPITVTNV